MSEARIERRRLPRYPVRLEVETEQGKGITRDISASGIYFETAERYATGSLIRFTLVLEHSGPAPIRWSCAGDALRVESRGNSVGVAVSITSHWIKPSL